MQTTQGQLKQQKKQGNFPTGNKRWAAAGGRGKGAAASGRGWGKLQWQTAERKRIRQNARARAHKLKPHTERMLLFECVGAWGGGESGWERERSSHDMPA